MFISILDLFKIGIGPSSSHTMGPMVAANYFLKQINQYKLEYSTIKDIYIRCTLKGSLAFTGKGHATHTAVMLGLNGYQAEDLICKDIDSLIDKLWKKNTIKVNKQTNIKFLPKKHIIFDFSSPLKEHPNGMIFEIVNNSNKVLFSEIYFSIGGGFINTLAQIKQLVAPLKLKDFGTCPYPFDSANMMLEMSHKNNLTIAQMKKLNELKFISKNTLNEGLDNIWNSMKLAVENGLNAKGLLPGKLNIQKRANNLYKQLKQNPKNAYANDWLSVYAMAVNEENAMGHMVVTAPTNGASGVIPAILYYFLIHKKISKEQIREFLLTASAIGSLIKHRSSISGAEVGCQGEVGSASSMGAAGLCAILGGTSKQIENAAEIALEHHLGLTCDPVGGLVQVPCIERNAFGAIKALTAASIAIKENGNHFMPLDACIEAMKQTGLEMSEKYKETSLGGLAVSITQC